MPFSTNQRFAYFVIIWSFLTVKSLVIIKAGCIFPCPVMAICLILLQYFSNVIISSATLSNLVRPLAVGTLILFHILSGSLDKDSTIPLPRLRIVINLIPSSSNFLKFSYVVNLLSNTKYFKSLFPVSL